jgi:hypothetical protein
MADASSGDARADAIGSMDAAVTDGSVGDGAASDGAADACAPTSRCGQSCCGPDEACESNACVLRCGERAQCATAAGARCCAAGDVCYLEACVTPGPACDDLNRCAAGTYCDPSLRRCLPRAMGEACEYRPMPGAFNPQLKWAWTSDPMVLPMHAQVEVPAMVASLTDDNGDGLIDRNDTPDVVFITHPGGTERDNGVLRIVSGADGSRIFPTRDPGYRLAPGAPIAIADVEPRSPGPEIMACSENTVTNAGQLVIISAAGAILRMVDVPCGLGTAPAVADMEGDGVADIAVRNIVVRGDGTVKPGFAAAPRDTRSYVVGNDDTPTFADVAGEGELALVLGNRAYRPDGTPLWNRAPALPPGYPAVADVTGDGRPEVVVVHPTTHSVVALDGSSGATVWGPIEINILPVTMGPDGGGPPTIADFDGDGDADVALAGGYNYLVLDGRTGRPLWHAPTSDTSSRVTGSSVFDFEGDGRAEVVYADENQLRVYRGNDGNVLWSTCNTSVTLWEYPVIADVDADDHADIVVISNNWSRGAPRYYQCMDGRMGPTGVRVYSDPFGDWVRTRRIWNQHSYHVTNIDDDGAIPRRETRNWTVPGLNNFRQNVQPEGLFDAPDLVAIDAAADLRMCPTGVVLSVRVVNRGRAGVSAGVPVTFRVGDPMGANRVVGRALTTRRLLPGESEVVRVNFALPMGMEMQSFSYFAVINDPAAMPNTAVRECRTTNNTSAARTFQCTAPG